MSFTILHTNSPEIKQTISKIQQRNTLLSSQALEHIQDIKRYFSSIETKNGIHAIIQSTPGEIFHTRFSDFIKKYYKAIAMKQCISKLRMKKNTNITQDLTDLSQSKVQEFAKIPLSPEDSFVCIESGILGKTAQTVHALFGCSKIFCLNNHHESSLLAREYLGEKNFTYITNDGTSFDYKNIDRVYIPNIVLNKDAIIEQILRSGNKKVRILLQKATGLFQLFYINHSENIQKFLCLEQRTESNRKFSTREILQFSIL